MFSPEAAGRLLFALLAMSTCGAHAQDAWEDDTGAGERCPRLYPKKFIGYTPIGNLTAGNYTEQPSLKVLRACVMGCCRVAACNAVLAVDDKCYHVECYSNELCVPQPRGAAQAHTAMVLVRPVLPDESWEDILANYRQQQLGEAAGSPEYRARGDAEPLEEAASLAHYMELPEFGEALSRRLLRPHDYLEPAELLPDPTGYVGKLCEVGVEGECPAHAQCAGARGARRGACRCRAGYKAGGAGRGACVPTFTKDSAETPAQSQARDEPAERAVQKLIVSVASQEIELPENKVTLSAFTIPDEKSSGGHYSYVWTLVDQPKDKFTGNMNQNDETMVLTDLTEGQYQFKVTVNGTTSYGEGFANVTVLPAARTNTPPRAVIAPAAQTVKPPNTGAVLDGSASKDDDGIVSWHWEVASGPIGYQPRLPEGATLELKDLTQPGNYTFKLTVQDTDGVKNSTTANITVLNHTDYPPEANAGQDVIVYLPNSSLTLNGSLSSDDHEIVSWEWTKAAGDEDKAVDMQNTHSPYLQLSNLSEGVYAFVLKVTDSSGQSSSADVHVFVKPPTNTPPVADAGSDQFISLPRTWVTLDGSASHDDHRIVSHAWSQLAGPGDAVLLSANETAANATRLTKGVYVFRLTVLDDNGNAATDNVTVTVAQTDNRPPKADGGGDQVLALPLPVLVLNGSRSSDDFRVVAWRWRRARPGAAAGTVALASDTTPVLLLTDIVPGRYVFELTVTDDQGLSDSDTVSVQVKPDPLEDHLLEMTLNEPVSMFTGAQLESLQQKLSLLLGGDVTVNVSAVRAQPDTDNAQLLFCLREKGVPVEGMRALSMVRHAGWGPGGGGAAVTRLRTARCLSACSGRGVCDQRTRTCRCDAFWMQSPFAQLDPDAPPNCEWSVVYAALGCAGALAGAGGACWAVLRAARRLCAAAGARRPAHSAAPRAKYRLLPAAAPHTDTTFHNNASDTETDSDVLFESRGTRESSFSRRLLNGDAGGGGGGGGGGSGGKRNGHKPQRKVKT